MIPSPRPLDWTGRALVRGLPLFALVLAGCAEQPRLGETKLPMAVKQEKDLPPPSGGDLVAATTAYRIGPLDKLSITVFGLEDLSGKFQTDAAAHLSFPLIGEVDASGKTPTELGAMIATRLGREWVRDPQVVVNLEETSSQVYTVDGQVGKAGTYPITGNVSLMRAVANAQGTSEFAREDDVVVFRTVNGEPLAALYNLGAIRRGLYHDPKIYANDVIVVGDSKARRMFQQFLQTTPILTTPLILALERL